MITIIAYADDNAIVAKAPVTFKVGELLEETADSVVVWLGDIGIELALDKSELIIPTRKRTYNTSEVSIKGYSIKSKASVKYLGVQLDQRTNYKAHASVVAEKADKAIRSLRGIMPNLGPRQGTRKLLAAVPLSILLYGAPIWSRSMSAGGWKLMVRCQRWIALRVASAYRTISGDALLVIAGVPPIDLSAIERTDVYEQIQGAGNVSELRANAKRKLHEAWQERWHVSDKGEWTRRLIPDIHPWVRRRYGSVTFHITQALSGHGCFASYLRRFGLLDSAKCWFCVNDNDDALHTLFECSAWEENRAALAEKIGAFTPDNLLLKMTGNKTAWDETAKYITCVMKCKEEEERRRQSGQTPSP